MTGPIKNGQLRRKDLHVLFHFHTYLKTIGRGNVLDV